MNLISPVRLSPSHITRYLHENNFAFFDIIDGSEYCVVKANSSTLAEWYHDNSLSKIRADPKQEGMLMLFIEDQGVENTVTANATLLISDISRIVLEGGGLIE